MMAETAENPRIMPSSKLADHDHEGLLVLPRQQPFTTPKLFMI